MSTAPTLNGQVIGQAHYATRALLERAVAPLGLSFGQVLTLNVLAAGTTERTRLVHRITSTLKVDEPTVHTLITQLVDAGLAQAGDHTSTGGGEPQVRLTDTGHTVRGRVADAVAGITARLYGDIPADETSVAARVLALVTQRANAELAAIPGGATTVGQK
ncbi:DNA-binding transcriptional regulator, MarR family [Micromonospora coriariae]|uniref:DNA-binding transcriptional regulator, MarR family n=1 Tax=Micromonospora coriariae TaxID=285665 RepID=A0A1C4XTJ4_9ACTN|nr:MarR family winged helix-turn-helix transcriptional regulator [Micromonospora coriariae]SCF11788.1 DNA-binding transcriptional regulator, MarR family [Micromonospora coriariae]